MSESQTPKRPSSSEKMETITVTLPHYMMKELRERSAETSQPMDYIVRQALVEFFENLPRLPTKKY